VHIPQFSAVLVVAAALALSCHVSSNQHRFDLPGVVLWAWERPEDLRFVDPQRAGIAFVAATALICSNGSISFRPRMQRLELPANAALLPVVHVETQPQPENVQMQALISGIGEVASLPNVRGVQIDFEARRSERSFYRTLLESMRRETDKPIGITALASWCIGDRWLDGEPIVEAVPMFFRMGRRESRDAVSQSSVCRSSIGLSTDERWPTRRAAGVSRVYLFNPRSWKRADYVAALRRIQDWK
jgi:hypothetical protein